MLAASSAERSTNKKGHLPTKEVFFYFFGFCNSGNFGNSQKILECQCRKPPAMQQSSKQFVSRSMFERWALAKYVRLWQTLKFLREKLEEHLFSEPAANILTSFLFLIWKWPVAVWHCPQAGSSFSLDSKPVIVLRRKNHGYSDIDMVSTCCGCQGWVLHLLLRLPLTGGETISSGLLGVGPKELQVHF